MNKVINKVMLSIVAALGLSAMTLTVRASGSATLLAVASGSASVTLLGEGGGDKPSEKPDKKPDGDGSEEEGGGSGGGGTPPDKPGEGGGGNSGGSGDTLALTGVLQLDSGSASYDGGTLASTNSDENVILVQSNACLKVSNYTLNKSGDYSDEDNSNFYALNAVVVSKTGGTNLFDNCVLNSNGKGANCMFATGSGSTIYAYNCTLNSTKDSSRGLDATYSGTVIASKMTIITEGAHCAALATDKGKGYISAADSRFSTAGDGSPLIYSTGTIEANGVTGTATGAQIACIEGLSKIRVKNSNLSSTSDKTGSGKKDGESVPNGVMIYQSNSGDSEEGTATFEVSDTTFTSAITNGTMFYITNTKADVRVRNTVLNFDSSTNFLLKVAGNNSGKGWGTPGSNGAEVVFTAIDQRLVGKITVDGISSLDMYLTNTTYTGTFVNDTTYTGSGDGIELFLGADSVWTVTDSCTLKGLTASPDATIVDSDGKTVPIVSASGATLAEGTSDLTITVSSYTRGEVAVTNVITAFEIDRSAFEEMYESSGGKGGVTGSYYFKPHAPENAIVKVKHGETCLTPDMDHKYWVDDYWVEGEGVTVEIIYATQTGYFFADGTSSTNYVRTITENKIDVYPPEGFEIAYAAQAKSNSSLYPTLKAAIDAAKSRTKITLLGDVTLEETLTITNSISIDFSTNAVTLGSAVTTAFRFTGGKSTTLSGLTIDGNGCLLDVEGNAQVTLTNNCVFTCDSAASVYCATKGKIVIALGTRKSDGVVIAAPDGCYWLDGVLVEGTPPEAIAADEGSEPYADALAATNAAAQINANKADSIAVPTGVEGAARLTYLTKVMAMATGDNRVVVELTPEAEVAEQKVVDAAVTSEATVAALTGSDTTTTIATTTPGLYYWIQGGTEVGAVSESGVGVLSTDGGAVELTKPTLDASNGRAFFRIAAGVSAPASAGTD